MKRYRLTERQRAFATEHHNVLEEFLINGGLDYDNYYDVVVFKFLKAVKLYDESSQKRAFDEFAVSLMQSAVDNYRQSLKKRRENMQVMSLDYLSKRGCGLAFGEKFPDDITGICDRAGETLHQYILSHTYPTNVHISAFI